MASSSNPSCVGIDLQRLNRFQSSVGFSSALFEKMCETTWIQGRQTESNEQFTVSWTFHSDKGLEVMYEVKSN